jgi:hypothetical protein
MSVLSSSRSLTEVIGRYFPVSESEAHDTWGENIEGFFWSDKHNGYLAG